MDVTLTGALLKGSGLPQLCYNHAAQTAENLYQEQRVFTRSPNFQADCSFELLANIPVPESKRHPQMIHVGGKHETMQYCAVGFIILHDWLIKIPIKCNPKQ